MNTMDRSDLQKKYGDEQVFVVDAFYLGGMTEGFTMFDVTEKDKAENLVDNIERMGYFMPRWEAEYNPEVRQIIPYVVLLHDPNPDDLFADPDKITMFATERLNMSGEDRLKGFMSVGIGGHINIEDNKEDAIIGSALIREMEEETTLRFMEDFEKYMLIGFINDNSNEVSRDHFGLVFTIITDSKAEINERDTLRGMYMPWDSVLDNVDKFENWSQLIIKKMEG